jgi:hypothetical protein
MVLLTRASCAGRGGAIEKAAVTEGARPGDPQMRGRSRATSRGDALREVSVTDAVPLVAPGTHDGRIELAGVAARLNWSSSASARPSVVQQRPRGPL